MKLLATKIQPLVHLTIKAEVFTVVMTGHIQMWGYYKKRLDGILFKYEYTKAHFADAHAHVTENDIFV